jgi:transcriptional regulator with XRE-family HTH domain
MKIKADNLPKRIQEARGKLTRSELAAKIGVSERTIYNYESGASAPTTQKLEEIGVISGCCLRWLVEGYNCKIVEEIQRSGSFIDESANTTPEALTEIIKQHIIYNLTDVEEKFLKSVAYSFSDHKPSHQFYLSALEDYRNHHNNK